MVPTGVKLKGIGAGLYRLILWIISALLAPTFGN